MAYPKWVGDQREQKRIDDEAQSLIDEARGGPELGVAQRTRAEIRQLIGTGAKVPQILWDMLIDSELLDQLGSKRESVRASSVKLLVARHTTVEAPGEDKQSPGEATAALRALGLND